MKRKIGELFLQIIPVMIGVYLGFVVSNWADNNKIKSKTDLLKKNIIAELEANKKRIEGVIEYHQILRDSSNFYSNAKNLVTKPDFFKGVRTLTLTNSAFETGVQTGLINELPIDKIQSINDVYTLQESYNDFATILLSGLITMDITDNDQGMKKVFRYLAISMTDIVIKENFLLEQYESIINKLNSE